MTSISSSLALPSLEPAPGPATAELLARFRSTGRASLTPAQHERLRAEFAGTHLDDEQTLEVIAAVHRDHGMLVDPHTAVGIGTAERLRRPDETVVTLATAHPAKFGDAVAAATGVYPEMPPALAAVFDRPERTEVLADDLAVVEDFVDGVRR